MSTTNIAGNINQIEAMTCPKCGRRTLIITNIDSMKIHYSCAHRLCHYTEVKELTEEETSGGSGLILLMIIAGCAIAYAHILGFL